MLLYIHQYVLYGSRADTPGCNILGRMTSPTGSSVLGAAIREPKGSEIMDIEEILESSEKKVAISQFSVVIDDIKDLEEIIEVLREVYNRKPFDSVEIELVWVNDDG
jgi:hypothetical protein